MRHLVEEEEEGRGRKVVGDAVAMIYGAMPAKDGDGQPGRREVGNALKQREGCVCGCNKSYKELKQEFERSIKK
jgi:hypothetical protein